MKKTIPMGRTVIAVGVTGMALVVLHQIPGSAPHQSLLNQMLNIPATTAPANPGR